MKLNYLLSIGCLFFISSLKAQVLIGQKAEGVQAHAMLDIYNHADNPAQAQGILFPKVDNETELPLYDPTQPDLFQDDPTMEGMLLYQSDIAKVRYYDGEKWNTTLYEDRLADVSRISFNEKAESPKMVCTLVFCGNQTLSPLVYRTTDFDRLAVVKTNGDFSMQINETGFYRFNINLMIRTSGIHVTPPVISVRALKKTPNQTEAILTRRDVALNDAILITSNTARLAATTFQAFVQKGDLIKFQLSGAVDILTVADVYELVQDDRSYIEIERIL